MEYNVFKALRVIGKVLGFVICISEPSEDLARLANPRATARFSVSPEVYCKYQVGDEFDSTTEIW